MLERQRLRILIHDDNGIKTVLALSTARSRQPSFPAECARSPMPVRPGASQPAMEPPSSRPSPLRAGTRWPEPQTTWAELTRMSAIW